MIWLGVVLIIVCLLAGCIVVIGSDDVDITEHNKGVEISTDLELKESLNTEGEEDEQSER